MQKQSCQLIIIISTLILVYSGLNRCYSAQEKPVNNYLIFEQLLEQGPTAKAIEIGEDLFTALISKYPENKGLSDLKKKIEVAENITKLIITDFKSKQKKTLVDIGGLDIFSKSTAVRKNKEQATALVPTPERLYWSNIQYFQSESNFEGLRHREAGFLYKYYDLRMKTWIGQIIGITNQVIITNPESSDLYQYSFILPLLYKSEGDRAWEREDFLAAITEYDNFESIADFCLLRLERPRTAIAIAKFMTKNSFIDWCAAASERCTQNNRPDTAEILLRKAIEKINDETREVELRLKIAKNYGDCGDSTMAVEECKQIASEFPQAELYGKVISSYFSYLAKEAKAEKILSEIDAVLEKPQCENYRAQLLYLKWWALHKRAQVDAAYKIGEKLIKDYGANACIAPILLAHATDALSNQDYKRCEDLLIRLTENFPETNSAQQAQKILSSLDKENGPLVHKED
ncbi:hypothetical protein ACFL3G_08755 [Planctomycetota bacterium]